ncbi:hypothetical protein LTR70_008817 [Exophiala xenobiotica]|uniref:DUF6604 domain-containing protein n=1 Tax=Lithohypha guttulata TaxID=1690604 RepID=A0ABR0K076_9EURO|nr:hypothetical protein LTR24_008973 [Lithohypha guttulata]KAK5311395.1 hypothetical protein LTR70_008817 [Exophiala xenobiotica]
MLPDFLVGTYRQYKQDTKTIAVWLASTARSYGYIFDASSTNQDDQVVKKKAKAKVKPKPKTKKQQRDAARRIPAQQRKVVIPISDFVPLAAYITEHIKLPTRVPPSMLTVIERVIEARTDCGTWFKNDAIGKDGHKYFIGILQQVHKILQPYTVLLEGLEDEEVTLVDNVFDNLTVEEPSEAFLNAPGFQATAPNLIDRMVYEFTDLFMGCLEGYLEESFAAAALFKDINTLYTHSIQIWQQYKEGKVDLMTASLVSNTAIDFMRRLEEDFFEQFPRFWRIDEDFLKQLKRYDSKHKDAQQIINVMFRAKCNAGGKDMHNKKQADDQLPNAHFNLEVYDDAQHLFLDMMDIFFYFYISSQKFTKVCYRADLVGVWDPETNHSNLSNEEKYRNNARILLEFFPDLGLLATSIATPLAEDELTKSCRNWFDLAAKNGGQPHIHIWALAACRLFCDIHHILGPNIGKPFETVQRIGRDAKAAIANCISMRDREETSCWPVEHDVKVQVNLIERIDNWLFKDEIKDEIMHRARNVRGYKKVDQQLLRHHPLLCGLFEFNIRIQMQELGLLSLGHFHKGAMVAHLYNAVQQEGFCQTEWSDMNFLIELQTPERLFVGGKPKAPEEYLKRIMLYLGISPETFAKGRRQPGMIISKKGSRTLGLPGAVLNVFRGRHGHHSDSEISNTALEVLEKAVDVSYELTRGHENSITIRPRDPSDVKERATKESHKTSKYSPMELLLAAQFGLSRDLPDIKFDYFFLHRSCSTFLRSIYDMVHPAIEKYFPPNLSGEEGPLHLTNFIFSIGLPAAQLRRLVRPHLQHHLAQVAPGARSLIDQQAILRDIGEFLQNKIQNGRFHSRINSQVRQMKGNSEVLICEYREDTSRGSRITFKKHKPIFHKHAACTRSHCVCGANAKLAKKKE